MNLTEDQIIEAHARGEAARRLLANHDFLRFAKEIQEAAASLFLATDDLSDETLIVRHQQVIGLKALISVATNAAEDLRQIQEAEQE